VAKLSNKSIATVSRVINGSGYVSENTKKDVLEAVKKLNYNPNQIAISLTTKKTSTLGLLIPDITNSYFGELIRHIESRANDYGFQIFLCNYEGNREKVWKYIQNMMAKSVDAIIFTVPKENGDILDRLKDVAPNMPVIQIGCSNADEKNIYNVTIDYEYGGYIATKYLLELGHRDICFIAGLDISYVTRKRLEGYKRALKDYNVEFIEDRVIYGEYSLEHGYFSLKQLIQDNNIPTAVLAGNDKIAIGIYKALSEANLKIGKDVSIIGNDDIDIANYIQPSLTTLKLPVDRIGTYVADLAYKIIKNENGAEINSLVYRPELIKRESTVEINREVYSSSI
jgi:LacI family transcriptional regulator